MKLNAHSSSYDLVWVNLAKTRIFKASVIFSSLTMKVALVSSILVLLIGLGYSFKLSDFFDDQTQRQSSVEDQILPVFTIAFFASLFNSFIFGLTNQNSGK